MNLTVQHILSPRKYFVKEKINNQIYYMEFKETDVTCDTIYYNIALCVASKRKQVINFENEIQETGKSLFTIYFFCKQAYELLENELKNWDKEYNKVITVHWLDNRRRDAYYHFLKKYGFKFEFVNNKKCLCKRIKV